MMTIAVLLACREARGGTANVAAFDAANRLYEGQKYADAAAAYEALARTGPWSANLYYNLGNAEWKLGQAGKAVVNYERALELEPGHPEARANLEFVRNQTGAKYTAAAWWEQPLEWMGEDGAAILLAACVWMGMFVMAMPGVEKRAGRWVAMAGCVLGAAYAAGCLWHAGEAGNRAVVVSRIATARVAPAEVAPAADMLPGGSEVQGPEDRGAWVYCTLPNGTKAWVPVEAIERLKRM